MPYCSVFVCSNNKETHRFPNRDNMYLCVLIINGLIFVSLNILNQPNIIGNSVICSHHFTSLEFKTKMFRSQVQVKSTRFQSIRPIRYSIIVTM